MKVTYQIRQDEVVDEENKIHTIYGVNVLVDNSLVDYIPDVFFNKLQAQEFVELCNHLKLCHVHLKDVVEDILSLL